MNSSKRKQKICMKEFIPNHILSSKNDGKSYNLKVIEDDIYLTLFYDVESHNQYGLVGTRRHNFLLSKYIKRSKETFEVLGLLQAEMGKQQDGKIVFCNHEYRLINKVTKWFEKEFDFSIDKWKWYIKVNINEPSDLEYKKKVEEKVINYWIEKSKLRLENSYPKPIHYVKHNNKKTLKYYDYGTLIIEKRYNLFSQIIKKLVKTVFTAIIDYEDDEMRSFMRGIFAGESCVEIHIPSKKYRVHLSAIHPNEKKIFHDCLKKLGIKSIIYKHDKLVISKKQNNLKLLKQKLMTLSPQKYNKFLRMMSLYQDFDGLNKWKNDLQKPWNKIPLQKINKITELHSQHPDWPAWKIAQIVGVSDIKVQRVRRELREKLGD